MSIPEQPFGFVAGRWVLSLADTPMDSDRAPDYKPLYPGSVIFNNKLSHRVVGDGEGGAIGIVKTRYEAKLNEDGRLIDAEEHEFVALPVGVYSVTFSFGQYSWPNFDIEVKAEHTLESPLWLPSKSPIPSGPGVVHVVSEEARLAAEAAAASAWEAVDTPGRQGPQGIQGPPGDLDPEHLAGAPRLTNKVHDKEWFVPPTSNATIDSQADGAVKFTATASPGFIRSRIALAGPATYYVSAEVKTTSDQVYFGASLGPVYHSGSGDWERLSGLVTLVNAADFQVRDQRSSGWDQIEVRDAVQISLTEVFGAGREPTKEYMDALLAKHGHYIGPVEPFVLGDVLRVDNSVGTRVFLDHPGGTTMIHGDTGWRDMSSYLPPGVTGTFYARRTLHATDIKINVTLTADWEHIGGSKSAATIFMRNLPIDMFAYDSHNLAPLIMRQGNTGAPDGTAMLSYQSQTLVRISFTSSSGGLWGDGTILKISGAAPNDRPWPDTLPGTPL